MNLLEAVELALEKEKRSMGWLAGELDRTLEGLKLSLKNETIKYSDTIRKFNTGCARRIPRQNIFSIRKTCYRFF